MSSPSDGNPSPGQPAAAGAPDSQATQDTRLDHIEAEQREQRGILGRIEQALTGGPPKADKSSSGGPDSGSPDSGSAGGLSVAEQVRKGVEEIEAKKAAAAKKKADGDAAESRLKNIEDRLPEVKPAESAPGRKQKLQRILIGKPDQR